MQKEEKEKIRQDALKHRNSIIVNPDDAEKIVTLFFQTIPDISHKSVAIYWPINSELDTYPLIKELLRRNIDLCLPKTGKANEPLTFLKWDGKEPLTNGGFGTKAPNDTEKNRTTPDIMIIPLLAFDRYGTRLGYGQGHYDKTISAMKERGHTPTTVGYAYDQQICLFPLPKEDHDQKLDMILTPTQCYTVK